MANPVTIGGLGVTVAIDESLFCWLGGEGAMGLRRDRSGDASEESLPVGGTATECCHTAPDITAVRATRHNSSIGLLEGIQHYRADWISPLHG